MSRYFWKDVISPGRLFVREQDEAGNLGGVMVFDADAQRVQHWNKQAKAMLSAGLAIPIPLEHGDEGAMDPREAAAARTRHNTGWVVDSRINSAGMLQFKTKIDDPAIARKIEQKTIRMVSPLIEPTYLDGRGREWSDVIVHLALTNKAVIQPQGGFQRAAASVRGGAVPKLPAAFRGICCQAVALSSSGGGRMGGQRDDDENLDDENDADSSQEVATDDDDNDFGEGLDVDANDGDKGDKTGGGGANIALNPGMDRTVSPELVEALARHNLYIPDDCRLSDLESMLMVSLNTAAMAAGLMDDDTGGEDYGVEGLDEGQVNDNNNQNQSGAGVVDDDDEKKKKKSQMQEESLTVPLSTPNAGKGPGIGAPAKSRFDNQGQPAKKPQAVSQAKLSAALTRNAFTSYRQSLVNQLDELRSNGQIPPAEHARLVATVNAPNNGCRLSLRLDGTVNESAGVALSIANYKNVPKGTFFSEAERSAHYTEHSLPQNLKPANDMTSDDAKSIVDDAFGRGERKAL